jgi:ADP-heptose:LPS heptosyltransferase
MIRSVTETPHAIRHIHPKTGALLRVEHTVVKLPPTADRLTTLDELRRCGRIAVVRSGGLGDVKMLLPAIQAVKQALPELEVDLFTQGRFLPLLWGLSFLHETHDISVLNDAKYDLVVNVNTFPERNPNRLTIDRARIFGRAFGVELSDTRLELPLSAEEEEEGRAYVEGFTRPVIGICSTAARRQSEWPHHTSFIQLARERIGGSYIRLCGQPVDDPAVDDAPLFGIRALMSVLAALDLLVTTDTGMMHLGFGVGTPRMGCLFGVSAPQLRIPDETNYWSWFPKGLSCAPCDMGPPCSRCRVECMALATGDTVLKGIEPLLRLPQGRPNPVDDR